MTVNQDSRRFPLTKWDPGVLKIYLLRNNHELLRRNEENLEFAKMLEYEV